MSTKKKKKNIPSIISALSRIAHCKQPNLEMTFELLCSANIHQADVCLLAETRGRQCVPACLMFLCL